MQFNSLLTNAGNLPDILGIPKLIKNNKPNYLFSDIIRIVGTNQNESSNSNFNAVSANTDSNIFKDILDKAANVSDKITSTSDITAEQTSINTPVANNSGNINTVSATNLQNFLNDLFNQLSGFGFVLNNVKGISSQAANMADPNMPDNQDLSVIAGLQTVFNEKNPSFLKVNSEGKIEVSSDALDSENKKTNKDSKSTVPGAVNLNQVILGILQSNKPVVLNFNFQDQPVQIEISNNNGSIDPNSKEALELKTTSGKNSFQAFNQSIGNTSPGKFINDLLDGISNGSLKYQAVSSVENADNHVLLASSLNEVKSNESKLTEIENSPSSISEILNNHAEVSEEKVNAESVQSKTVDQEANIINSQIIQIKSESDENYTITASSGNKDTSLTNIQDLKQFLSDLDIKNQAGSALNSSKPEVLSNLNNAVAKSNQQNAGDANANSGSLIKNYFQNKNVTAVGDAFPVYNPELFSDPSNRNFKTNANNFIPDLNNQKFVQHFINKNYKNTNTIKDNNQLQNTDTNNDLSPIEIKNKVADSKDLNLINASIKNPPSEILKEISVQSKVNSGIISAAADGNYLKSKEIISTDETKSSIPANDTAKLQFNPNDKLAGSVMASKQSSNDDSENKSGNSGKITAQTSSTGKTDTVISTNVNTSGKDNGKSSDAWKKQFGDAAYSSSQALNSDKQNAIKNNMVDQNVQQFHDLYKTIQASDLITEISRFVGQGTSKSIELKLKPDDLGKVKVSVEVIDKVVHTNIEVENESVKQVVQTNIDNLKQSLTQSGLQLSNISVSISGGEAKSNKSFVQKKKTNHTFYNKKIDSAQSVESSKKSMGYNTYEYLI